MACPACAKPLPDGARFCPFCGEQVVVRGIEERRLVTVLFADIVGFTGLVEFLDPERAKRLLDEAFEHLIGDIVRFGGTVDKVLGDGILAVFGAPVAHDDDADRAVRAAFAMHASLRQWATGKRELTRLIELRVGINTGEVLVGSVAGTDDVTVMGDVVNVASRLESLAPPNGVYVGDATAALTSSAIVLEPVDDVDVRGREQRERVWSAVEVQANRSGLRVRRDTPFVGRVEQRRRIEGAMRTAASGQGAAVAVVGEPGSGKTRLVTEVLDGLGDDVAVLTGGCAPYGEDSVWEPIAAAMFGELSQRDAASAASLRELTTDEAVSRYGFDRDEPALTWLVEGALRIAGHPSRFDDMTLAQERDTLFRLVVEALRRHSASRPLVLFIDDVQWAAPMLLELLARLVRSLVDRPFLLITAQRSDPDLKWPPRERVADVALDVIDLVPLDRDEADRLISAVSASPMSPVLAEQIHRRSGGNPLFLTELTELAVEQSSPGDESDLPGSLRVLITARLDRLPPEVRAVVDNAAVIGSSGHVRSLETFAAELDQPFSEDLLRRPEIHGLLALDAPRRWRFHSDVVREVAYQTLTKVDRAERHAGVARVLRDAPRVAFGRLAHHSMRAAELVCELGPLEYVEDDIVERAVALALTSAERSLDTGAYQQARRTAQRALDLGVEDQSIERRLRLLRAIGSVELREYELGHDDAQLALASAIEDGDRHDEGVARRLLGNRAHGAGDLPTATEQLSASINIFRDLGDDRMLASTLADRGFTEIFGGSLSAANQYLAEAEELAERLGDRHAKAWVHQHQALAAFMSGDAETATRHLDVAAEEFAELADRGGLSWAQAIRAYLMFAERRLDDAEQLAVSARAEALKLGERWAPAMMDSLLASIRLWTGDFVEAERLSRRSLQTFREIGDRFGRVQSLAPYVRSLVALGEQQAAERGIEEALAISETSGTHAFPAMVAAGALVHLGLGERAVVVSEIALERVLATRAESSEARTALALALCHVGRADEALGHLDATAGDTPYIQAVRALALSLIGDIDRAAAAVDAVAEAEGATYLDRVISLVAAVGLSWATAQGDDAAIQLGELARVARESGDAVAVAISQQASSLESDAPAPVSLGSGWRRVVQKLWEQRPVGVS